ncbi:MAG: sigma-70 family RNA polymerase sigma factor [Clostridia bacterium]|nr:sigma-70 family RNA polymerase sigma factor [Clostridia bacterium]
MNKSFDEIMEEYAPLLESAAASFSDKTGLSRDDVYQTASLALHRAYLTYTEGRGVTFGLYAKICVRNACVSEQRKRSADERRRNRSVSAAVTADEILPGFDRLDLASLTELEKNVIKSRAEGLSYSDIADRFGIGTKSVDNALRRAKNKLRAIYYGTDLT